MGECSRACILYTCMSVFSVLRLRVVCFCCHSVAGGQGGGDHQVMSLYLYLAAADMIEEKYW
jgi:hypothetical protein